MRLQRALHSQQLVRLGAALKHESEISRELAETRALSELLSELREARLSNLVSQKAHVSESMEQLRKATDASKARINSLQNRLLLMTAQLQRTVDQREFEELIGRLGNGQLAERS